LVVLSDELGSVAGAFVECRIVGVDDEQVWVAASVELGETVVVVPDFL
jgi:hypothetical protein